MTNEERIKSWLEHWEQVRDLAAANVTTAIGIRADEMRRVKDGGKVIYPIAMAEHHYGLCRHFEAWDLFGKSYVCGKFQTASGVAVEKRKKEMDK